MYKRRFGINIEIPNIFWKIKSSGNIRSTYILVTRCSLLTLEGIHKIPMDSSLISDTDNILNSFIFLISVPSPPISKGNCSCLNFSVSLASSFLSSVSQTLVFPRVSFLALFSSPFIILSRQPHLYPRPEPELLGPVIRIMSMDLMLVGTTKNFRIFFL